MLMASKFKNIRVFRYGCVASAFLFLLGSVSSWWWVMLVWPIPLWCQSWWYGIAVPEVVAWYGIAAGGHMAGICMGLYRLAGGCWYTKMSMPLVVFGYYFVITYVWMYGTSAWIKWLKDPWGFLCLWICTTWLYFIFVADYSLMVCGAWGGYSLFSPLIPLVDCPALLWPVPIVGERLFLLFIMSMQAWCGWHIINESKKTARTECFSKQSEEKCIECMGGRVNVRLVIIGLVLIWLGGAWLMFSSSHQAKHDYSPLGVIMSQFFEQDCTRAVRHMLCHVHDMQREHPNMACALFPESSMHGETIFSERGEQVAPDSSYKGSIVIGGFRTCGTRVHNTVWFIHDGCVIDYFDKQELLPITEYVPWWGRAISTGKQFFMNMPELSCPVVRQQRPVWEIVPGLHVVPYICSELFLARHLWNANDGPILALCNNAWAPCTTRWMMARAAAYRAVAWQRTIIYVAHSYSAVITEHGVRYKIVEESHICGR